MIDVVSGTAVFSSPLLLLYVGVFSLSGILCLASILRAKRIPDPDTRQGLTIFLLTSGLWAFTHVGYLLAPTVTIAHVMFTAGLVVGFFALFPWVYFCSAYTNRSIHREPLVWGVAAAVFVPVIGLKVTNSFHELYYTGVIVNEPFIHLAIEHGVLHWLAMGLAYAVAAIGLFMLFELFLTVNFSTKPLAALTGLMLIPIVANVAGELTGVVLAFTYEPIGVAIFAAVTVFVYFDTFRAIRVAGTQESPLILVSDDGNV